MRTMRKILREAVLLGFMALFFAGVTNFKLIQQWFQGNIAPGFLETNSYQDITFISLEEAAELLSQQTAFFIDSRSPALYQASHIPGALNLPYEDFDKIFRPGLIPTSQTIVVYCEGGKCRSSVALAQKLVAQGYSNIHVVLEGWQGWQAAGLPIEVSEPEKNNEL